MSAANSNRMPVLLREVMQERGIGSQKALAAHVGLGKTKINRWLQGKGFPNASERKKLAQKTGCAEFEVLRPDRRPRAPHFQVGKCIPLSVYARKRGGFYEQEGVLQTNSGPANHIRTGAR